MPNAMSDLPNKAPKKRQSSQDLLDDQLIVRGERKQESRKIGLLSHMTPSQKSVVLWTAIGLGVSLVAALGIYYGKKMVKKHKADKVESQSFGTDKHATWAKQIHKSLLLDSMITLGTDEELLRRTIRQIPTLEDWKKTSEKYRAMYKGRNMIKDISGDLSRTEYNEMKAIVNAKPKTDKDKDKPKREILKINWAKRIHAALSYSTWGFMWGTDEDAIKSVFMEFKTQKDYWGTKRVYYSIYGSNMYKDLKADMDDLHDYLKIVWRKPK